MATPALHPASTQEQEPPLETMADVIQLPTRDPDRSNTARVKRQDQTFDKLLALCRRHSNQDCFEYTPEITLVRDNKGKTRSKVCIFPIYEDNRLPSNLDPAGYWFNYLKLSEHGVETDSQWTTACQNIGAKAVEHLWAAASDPELNPELHARLVALDNVSDTA